MKVGLKEFLQGKSAPHRILSHVAHTAYITTAYIIFIIFTLLLLAAHASAMGGVSIDMGVDNGVDNMDIGSTVGNNIGHNIGIGHNVRVKIPMGSSSHTNIAPMPAGVGEVKHVIERYQKALEHFNKSKRDLGVSKKTGGLGLLKAKKRYLLSWTEFCNRWTVKVMARINNSGIGEELKRSIMKRLNTAIDSISDAKEKINNSITPEDLRIAAMQLREEWREARVQIRLAVFEFVEYKFERILEKIEQVRDRFEAAGMDVSSLDEKIGELKTAIEELRAYVDAGDVQSASSQIAEVKQVLREVFAEIKELARGYVGRIAYGYESSSVYAKVNGSFELNGNVTVLVRGVGDVVVTPESAIVSSKNALRGKEMKILARGKEITVSGTGDFRLLAHGVGVLHLTGSGYYRVKNPGETMSDEIPFNGSVTVEFGKWKK